MRRTLVLEVGKSYANVGGHLITLVDRKMFPARANRPGSKVLPYFIDQDGQRYLSDGYALKGAIAGLPSRERRHLCSPAQAVKVGQIYDYHWKDGQSVGRYEVTELTDKGYNILWSNGATLFIRYGVPLNYEAVLDESVLV